MSSTDKGFNEKRDFIRMKISSPLNARIAHQDNVIEGLCRDLSGGGMQVESKTEIPLNTELDVEVSSGLGHSPTLHATAKVVRTLSDGTGGFILGLEIIEVIR